MHVADNDNGAILRVITDAVTSLRLDKLKARIGAEDDVEFLELALTAYEEYGPGAADLPVTLTAAGAGTEKAFTLTPCSLATLKAECLRSGLSNTELAAKAFHALLRCNEGRMPRTATVAFLQT